VPSKLKPAVFVVFLVLALIPAQPHAQQTLGSINGTVTDTSGAVVQGTDVKIRNVGTNLEVDVQTKGDGSFSVVDLPIGTYEVTLSKEGLEKEVYPQIIVQGDRTTT
jgi:Carboxypeptidase regulatory-like domain